MMLEQQILAILARACEHNQVTDCPDMDLFEDDVFDSLAMILFVQMAEEEFDIEIHPASMDRECWRTPDRIVKMITQIVEEATSSAAPSCPKS